MEKTDLKNDIVNTIIDILFEVVHVKIEDLNVNLFRKKYECNAGDMIILIMELKKKYNISVEKLVDNIKEYSVNNIADEVFSQISGEVAA